MYIPAISGNALGEQNHHGKKLGEAGGFHIKKTSHTDGEIHFMPPNSIWTCWLLHTSGDRAPHVLSETIFILILLIASTRTPDGSLEKAWRSGWCKMWSSASIMFFQPFRRKKQPSLCLPPAPASRTLCCQFSHTAVFLRQPPSSRMSFPGAGRWQECAVWLHESSRNRFCETALWQNAREPHSREMLMFSNSSWQDQTSEGDAEPFWTVTARGKQKAVCQSHCGQMASSLWEKREEGNS